MSRNERSLEICQPAKFLVDSARWPVLDLQQRGQFLLHCGQHQALQTIGKFSPGIFCTDQLFFGQQLRQMRQFAAVTETLQQGRRANSWSAARQAVQLTQQFDAAQVG